ncbi:MAG: hypothetical protein RL264_1803 [Bacteroidota bacterium]|jgi:hypothetical protein
MTRQFKFLIGAIVIGVIFIGLSMLLENTNVEKTEISNNDLGTNFSPLENKIKVLSNQGYNPSNFITLNAEIHSSFSNQLITKAGEENLKLQLKETQTNLLFSECELFLKGSSSNSKQLLQWLDDLKRNFPEENKIAYFKSQINAYNYYAISLPNKINTFVRKECFDDLNSIKLKTEIQQMPKLDRKYSAKSKFITIKNNSIKLLDDYRSESYDEYGPCGENNL